MSDLYDFDASTRRIARAEQAVTAQRIYLAKQTDPATRSRAQTNLETLMNALEIAHKTHALILDVLTQREDDATTSMREELTARRTL